MNEKTIKGFIGRNKNGMLFLFDDTEIPVRSPESNPEFWNTSGYVIELNPAFFADIKWESGLKKANITIKVS